MTAGQPAHPNCSALDTQPPASDAPLLSPGIPVARPGSYGTIAMERLREPCVGAASLHPIRLRLVRCASQLEVKCGFCFDWIASQEVATTGFRETVVLAAERASQAVAILAFSGVVSVIVLSHWRTSTVWP
jgi:hypothetical protein